MPRFEVVGIGRETGRRRKKVYTVYNQEAAILAASVDGIIVEMGKIIQLPVAPPTESQLSYAKDLGIAVSDNATWEDVRDMISCCVDHDKPATERHKSFAQMYGIEYTEYVGRKRLFAMIFAALQDPSQIIDMISWFVYRVYRELVNGADNAPIKDPENPIIKENAQNLVNDSSVVKSIKKYKGSELIWFGEWTAPDGRLYNGGSNKTIAYKRVSSLLREKLKKQ